MVNLSEPKGAALGDSQATLGIFDDEASSSALVSLSTNDVDEGEPVIFTATLSTASVGVTTVVLESGAEILIQDGETTGTLVIETVDTALRDAFSISATISEASGGGFENFLIWNGSATANVLDTTDTTKVSLSATDTVAEDGTITYTATLTGGVANNAITVTLANGESITIAAGEASGKVEVAAPTDDEYVTDAITNSIASAVEANAGTAGALENLAVAGDTSVSTDVTENDTETAISLVDLAVDEGSGTASVTATIANAPKDGPVVVTLNNDATITFAVGATSATSTAFAIQDDDDYLDGETLTLTASVTSGGSEFENLTLDTNVDVVVSDTIDTVTVDLSATDTVAEDGTITYTATLTGGVANNAITVTLANGESITIAAGEASGKVEVAAPTDDEYVTDAITNSIASAVEANAGTAGALENLAVAGDTSVSTDVTENDTETAISLVDLAVDEGSGTASVTATIANAPKDGPVVVTLNNDATITFAVGATSATSTAFAIQDDDDYLDGETLTLTASVTSGGSEFENLTLDTNVDVVVSDTIDTVTVDLSATDTVAEDGTITYTATLTGGVANNAITVTLANGESITIAAGEASGKVEVAAPTDDEYVTDAITNSIASAVEANAGTAGALENLAVAGDTSVSTDVTENDTETAISLVDLAVDEGSGTASVTATIANAPKDGPVVVTLNNDATITFAVGATSATSTAFAIQDDDDYLDGETLTLTASVTSGGSEFENLTLDTNVDVVVSDTIDTVTVDLSATDTVAEDGTITYTATLTGGVANNAITVTLANGESITIAAGEASGKVEVAAPTDDEYVTDAITNSIASAVEANAGTAGALENLAVAGDTSVSTDVTENDTETAISLVDLAVDEGSGTASVTATIANAPKDGPVVVTLNNDATITFAVGATSATSTAFAIQDDDDYLDGETLTLTASVTSGGSEFENLTLDTNVDVVVSDTIDTVTVDLSATDTVAEDGTITYTATLTGGVANNAITVTLANGESITIAAGEASGKVEVAAPTDDEYVTDAITNSIASAVEANAGTAGALENLAVAGDTSVSTDVTENDTETAISLVDLAVDEGSGTASVTATIANAPKDGPVVVTLNNDATITFAVGATSATSTAFAIQDDDDYLDGETLTLTASVTSGGSEFENLTLDTNVDVVVSDTIDTVTVDLSATDTVAEDGTITYTATLTGGVANNAITVTLANGESITIAAGEASGKVEVAAPTDDEYVTDAITNSIASAVEANAGTAGALENLAVAGDTSVSTDVTENDTETAISLVDLAVDEGSGTASVTATIANAPKDGPVVVTLNNDATITFAVGATSATSTAFAIQDDDDYLDGETLTLTASVTSGGSEFENLTLDTNVDVVVSDTIDTVTVDLSATDTVAEDGTITYTATLTGGVANNAITVTLANGESITIAAGEASGKVEVAAPTDDEYVTDAITNSIASAVEANAGTAGALENLAVAGDTSVSTDVTENDTETAISLVDLAVDEGSGTASVTATIANAPKDGPVVVTLNNDATITFAVGATSATSTAFAIQDDDDYLDGETLTLTASVTSGGSEFENLTLDTNVDVVVSDTIDTVTVDLSATDTVAEDGTITYTATLTGGVANNAITVTLANGESITIAAGEASGKVEVAAPTDDEYVTDAITNSIASAVEANAGTAGALENLAVAGDTSVSTDVTENDTETAISLVDLAVDEGSGTASVTATIANAPKDGPVVVTLNNDATITFAVGATSATSTAFAIQDDDDYLDGETLTLTASVTSGGSEFENLTLDTNVDVVVSDTIDTVTVDLSATDTVAEDGTITYTATLTGGVANNAITVTLANGESITIAAGEASGKVEVAAPTDDEYVTDAITNSIASAVEANAGTAGALENLAVAGDTSVSTDVTENDTETTITLSDPTTDTSGNVTVTATLDNAVTDSPLVITLTNGQTITVPIGSISASTQQFSVSQDTNLSISGVAGANFEALDDTDIAAITFTGGNTDTINPDDDIVIPGTSSSLEEVRFDPGADGFGSISFTGLSGNVLDANGDVVSLNGEELLWQTSGGITSAVTAQGAVGFELSLQGTDLLDGTFGTYTVANVSSGAFTVGSATNYFVPDAVTGGNSSFFGLTDISGGTIDLVVSSSSTVNTNKTDFGVGQGNTVNTGESLTFSFYSNSSVSGSTPTGPAAADYAQISEFTFSFVSLASANKLGTYAATAYDEDGNKVGSVATGAVTNESVTLSFGAAFSYVKIEAVGGNSNGKNFSITINSFQAVEDLILPIDVKGVDANGNEVTGSFNLAIDQDSALGVSGITSAPIAIDLDGDGIEYLGLDAGVTFASGSDEAIRTAWVAAGDALLVFDANNSGTVDASREYVFTEWAEAATSDMAALREVFDTNQDDVLDARDDNWDQFKVWQDANSDGVTDEGELKSLDEVGITSIALTYNETSESSTEAGGDVLVAGQSDVTWADGRVTQAEDTAFAIAAADDAPATESEPSDAANAAGLLLGTDDDANLAWALADEGGSADDASMFALQSGEGEAISLADLLGDVARNDLADYIRVESDGLNTVVSINPDGLGADTAQQQSLTIEGVDLTTDTNGNALDTDSMNELLRNLYNGANDTGLM